MSTLENALVSQDSDLAAALEANTWKRNIAMAMRRLRHGAGMSQEEVATKAGMSQSHVAKTEAPYGGLPTLITLKKYAKACGRDVLHLEFLTSDELASRKRSADMSSPTPEAVDSEAPRESAPAEGAAIENGGVYLI